MATSRHFRETLQKATSNISSKYVRVPVAGQSELVYRELVYCYELYHQLRTLWPEHLKEFSLTGELDKRGNDLIREWKRPDFLVHSP